MSDAHEEAVKRSGAGFDVVGRRKLVLEFRDLSMRATGSSAAASALTEAVYAFICGLPGEGLAIAERCVRELATDCALGKEAARLRNLALARWLATGVLDSTGPRWTTPSSPWPR